jgi:hypothetical protein
MRFSFHIPHVYSHCHISLRRYLVTGISCVLSNSPCISAFVLQRKLHKKLVLWLVLVMCVAWCLLHTYVLYGLFVDTSVSSNYIMLNGSRLMSECWMAWICNEAVVARFNPLQGTGTIMYHFKSHKNLPFYEWYTLLYVTQAKKFFELKGPNLMPYKGLRYRGCLICKVLGS